jgi:hypothetical protein
MAQTTGRTSGLYEFRPGKLGASVFASSADQPAAMTPLLYFFCVSRDDAAGWGVSHTSDDEWQRAQYVASHLCVSGPRGAHGLLRYRA